MSNEYLKAADDANRLLAGFSAIKTVADAFAKVGSLVQAEKEAVKGLDAARKELATVETDVAAGKAAVKVAKDLASKYKEESVAMRDAMMNDAVAEANKIVDEANRIHDEKTKEASQIIGDAVSKVTMANANVVALKAEADELEGKINKLKAQAAKMLG